MKKKDLKDILDKNKISSEGLRKDNKGLKAANQTLNEKIASQVKFIEMMIKYDDTTKLLRTNTNKTSLGKFKFKKYNK